MSIDCVSAGHIVFGKPAPSLEEERRQIALNTSRIIDEYQDKKFTDETIESEITLFEEKENILTRKLTPSK